jgi:hypothetical protein
VSTGSWDKYGNDTSATPSACASENASLSKPNVKQKEIVHFPFVFAKFCVTSCGKRIVQTGEPKARIKHATLAASKVKWKSDIPTRRHCLAYPFHIDHTLVFERNSS